MTIRLVVGLGNPGKTYEGTRHNVGRDFVTWLAKNYNGVLKSNIQCRAHCTTVKIVGHSVHLVVPKTYMNDSGSCVKETLDYFKIPPEQMLVVHDELDLLPGVVRLKEAGCINGHNGLKDIVRGLGGKHVFFRLRIGIGHPGRRDKVISYLTAQKLPDYERELIEQAYQLEESVLLHLVSGNIAAAMQLLHTSSLGKENSLFGVGGAGHKLRTTIS